MRLYRLPTQTGFDDLTLTEAPRPTCGRGQVLVRMHAASLNFRDLSVATGKYMMSAVPPNLVPLSDGAGEVVAVGEGTSRVAPGDRVAGIFMQGWLGGELEPPQAGTALGGAIDGVLAEYVVFDEQGLVHIPEHLSYEQAATLPCAAVTAWNALYGLQPLQPGQTVLVLGTGGVSMFALQFARAAGARVIATSSSDEKLERVRAMGASEGINYKTNPEWQDAVRALTGGVDHVVEVGGPGTLARSLGAARRGGVVSLIGVLTRGQIDPLAIFGSGAIVRPIFVGSRQMFEAMNRAIALHRLEPVIDRTFAFDEAPQAYQHLKGATHIGKVVVRIG
ncbi:zinc-dependent alcohol dehydrogenase family protein [Lichenicoccus sp.]|uniref:zinc-dependent alcohol dehydrogenase family protein n=1 Tax=Lichenicoccus sp. TaxID=2781899 RepID=UPI003D12C9D7